MTLNNPKALVQLFAHGGADGPLPQYRVDATMHGSISPICLHIAQKYIESQEQFVGEDTNPAAPMVNGVGIILSPKLFSYKNGNLFCVS